MEFSRQEYWSGLLFTSPVDLLDPEIEPRYPTLLAGAVLLYRLSHQEDTHTHTHTLILIFNHTTPVIFT